jgi:outer membrane receptor protein involved in Fe transport
VYHDLYLSYRFDRQSTTRAASLLAGLELDLGINNVFHRSPPPDVTSLDRFYSPLGDPRLSRYILSLRKAF